MAHTVLIVMELTWPTATSQVIPFLKANTLRFKKFGFDMAVGGVRQSIRRPCLGHENLSNKWGACFLKAILIEAKTKGAFFPVITRGKVRFYLRPTALRSDLFHENSVDQPSFTDFWRHQKLLPA